jgi:hypothetical protein
LPDGKWWLDVPVGLSVGDLLAHRELPEADWE